MYICVHVPVYIILLEHFGHNFVQILYGINQSNMRVLGESLVYPGTSVINLYSFIKSFHFILFS